MIGFLFFISIFVLSQAATLIRFAHAHALVICFWRQLFASILLALPLLIRRDYADYKKLKAQDIWLLLFSGFLLFIHFFFFFKSVQETTVANSIILFCLNPVFTAIGAYIFFREKFSTHLAAASLLGFAGVLCLLSESLSVNLNESLLSLTTPNAPLLTGPHHSTFAGNIWGILSAVTFSAYILSGKKLRNSIGNIPFTFSIYTQTALYAFIACLCFDLPLFGFDQTTWITFGSLAVFPTLLGHALFTYCLNFLNVNVMSCATLIEPVFAAIAGNLLFHEKLSAHSTLGFSFGAVSVLVLYSEQIRKWWKK